MGRLKLKDGSIIPAIGTGAGGLVTIPEELDLVILLAASSNTITVYDRVGGTFTSAMAAGWGGFPYWNGSALETASVAAYPRAIRLDGRVFASASGFSGLPYFYLPHDAATPVIV